MNQVKFKIMRVIKEAMEQVVIVCGNTMTFGGGNKSISFGK